MKNIIIKISLPLLALLSACSEDDTKKDFIVTGHLYQDCSKVMPIANAKIEISEEVSHGVATNSNQLATCTTGPNGEFTLKGKRSAGGRNFRIAFNGGAYSQTILENAPLNKNPLDLFRERNTYAKVLLNSNRTFSETDTLYYGVKHHSVPASYITMPITSGVLGTAKILLQTNEISTQDLSVGWGIGVKEYIKSINSGTSGRPAYQLIPFSSSLCDTATVEINIPH